MVLNSYLLVIYLCLPLCEVVVPFLVLCLVFYFSFLYTCIVVPAREVCDTLHVVCMMNVVVLQNLQEKDYGLLYDGFCWFEIRLYFKSHLTKLIKVSIKRMCIKKALCIKLTKEKVIVHGFHIYGFKIRFDNFLFFCIGNGNDTLRILKCF